MDEKIYHLDSRVDEPKVTQHFDRPADDTWQAIGPSFKDLHYAGSPSANANERLYTTPLLQLRGRLYDDEWNSAYFECGRTAAGLPAADSYELSFVVRVWVDSDTPSGSSVRILVNALGRDRTNPATIAPANRQRPQAA